MVTSADKLSEECVGLQCKGRDVANESLLKVNFLESFTYNGHKLLFTIFGKVNTARYNIIMSTTIISTYQAANNNSR